ncbi:C40 family peptidase [Thioclava sp. FR2]|uniref:C40 family peptidase n=1 Tax=Thioclava sp. FR2 TaxID=3445780 RepID=UPI003EBA7499
MDRRLTPFSGRVALHSVKGKVEADSYTEGELASVARPLVDLFDQPNGKRDRQLVLGAEITVIDRQENFVFVQAASDGYCGWIASDAVGKPILPTHWVAASASHAYSGPKVQTPEHFALPIGARLAVSTLENRFGLSQVGYVPMVHLRPIADRLMDPVSVAESLLGTPYLWGGNSAAGIDCSGLVQVALVACGQPCPGDSDLQQQVGSAIPEDAPLSRGDLLFWKGHVAMVVDETRLIHANGHSMSVAYEDIVECTTRIKSQEGRGIIARRRP